LKLNDAIDLLNQGRWKEVEPYKDVIINKRFCKVVCRVCENEERWLVEPNPNEWRCEVCERNKTGLRRYTHCNKCGRTFNELKGDHCGCRIKVPLEGTYMLVKNLYEKKFKEPTGPSTAQILRDKKLKHELEKEERAKRIDQNLEKIAAALEKGEQIV